MQTGQDVGLGGGLVGVTRGIFGTDVAGAVAADDVGMGFVDDIGVGMAFAHGSEQIQIAADLRRTVADGSIVFDLAGNEDDGLICRRHGEVCVTDVVFADAVFRQCFLQH